MIQPVTVGTAGHIDHGKSALVRALTGTDPDRLAEEQRRGMTLDLGFAHLDLPSGRRIGIVDVPGHEALVHNMLAGAGGIDLVMLVVAADEGAMPQTREHVDILRFLRLSGGVLVLNKVDLVTDPEWLAAVQDDLADLVKGTALEGAPVVRVSARTGEGLTDLVAVLDRLAASVRGRSADGPVRLPVDRAFTMQGFGTVVTGTLWSGTVRPGDQLVLLPAGREVRVRGVHVHGSAVDQVAAGSRIAANLAGIEKQEVERGDVLVTPDVFRSTDRLDVRLRLLADAPSLKASTRVHFHLGSGAVVARAVFKDRTVLEPGADTVARLRLEAPVVAVHGDHFVVRRYSPTRTIGGGEVLSTVVPSRGRGRKTGGMWQEMAGPVDLVAAAVAATKREGLGAGEVAAAAGVDSVGARSAVAEALHRGMLIERGGRLFSASAVQELRDVLEGLMAEHHRRHPWRRGMPREELKSRATAGAGTRLFDEMLSDLLGSGDLQDRGGLLSVAGFVPALTDDEHRARDILLEAIRHGGVSPPTVDELRRLVPGDAADRMLQSLLDDRQVVAVTSELRYATPVLEQVRDVIVVTLRGGGEVTVATLRDRLQTSRKYALALLEYFDATRVTRRVGDRRVLGPQAGDGRGQIR